MKASLLALFLFLSIAGFATEKTPKASKAVAPMMEAAFQGGDGAFNSFKSGILNKMIRSGMSQGLPAGSYSVDVRFDVDAQGRVSNVQSVSSIGFGLEQQAVALFGKTPRWTPARAAGHAVKSTQVQSFRFEVL